MGHPNSSMQATSFPSHQLKNGLYVSGLPEQHKERAPTMSSAAMPYTGGDIKKSGELGKMFDIQFEATRSKKSGQLATPASKSAAGSCSGPLSSSGALRSSLSSSGPISTTAPPKHNNNSGPLSGSGSFLGRHSSVTGQSARHSDSGSGAMPKASVTTLPQPLNPSKHSGPLSVNLPATGLLTSGPLAAGPFSAGSSRRFSGPIDSAALGKLSTGPTGNNQAINNLSREKKPSLRRNFTKAVLGFTRSYPEAELARAKDGDYVKVMGVVTCGSVSLQSSFKKVNRCIYTSTVLHEYRGLNSLQANDKHRRFTWGLRHLERHIVDFYVSDLQSGLRILVKAGYGSVVSVYVDESPVLKISKESDNVPTDFLSWLTERNLSRDERMMRLSEGFIREGSTVTVLGVIQRHDKVLMITPPAEPISTGCQWMRCLLPTTVDGIIIKSEDSSTKVDLA